MCYEYKSSSGLDFFFFMDWGDSFILSFPNWRLMALKGSQAFGFLVDNLLWLRRPSSCLTNTHFKSVMLFKGVGWHPGALLLVDGWPLNVWLGFSVSWLLKDQKGLMILNRWRQIPGCHLLFCKAFYSVLWSCPWLHNCSDCVFDKELGSCPQFTQKHGKLSHLCLGVYKGTEVQRSNEM